MNYVLHGPIYASVSSSVGSGVSLALASLPLLCASSASEHAWGMRMCIF